MSSLLIGKNNELIKQFIFYECFCESIILKSEIFWNIIESKFWKDMLISNSNEQCVVGHDNSMNYLSGMISEKVFKSIAEITPQVDKIVNILYSYNGLLMSVGGGDSVRDRRKTLKWVLERMCITGGESEEELSGGDWAESVAHASRDHWLVYFSKETYRTKRDGIFLIEELSHRLIAPLAKRGLFSKIFSRKR